jgi:hypothetical protein
MPLKPAASTTAGQLPASIDSAAGARTEPVTGTLAVPAPSAVTVIAAVAVATAAAAFDAFDAFDAVEAAVSGRNASILSKVISNPSRGSGAIGKSRRPTNAI